MGKKWRRFNERLLQSVVAPHFQPASTERNHLMFREASIYFQHFKAIIKRIVRLMKDYEDLTRTVQGLLECRVPRLYTVESDGSVGAEVRDGDAILGTDIQMQRLTNSPHLLQTRISEEVISTLQTWFKSYERCKVLLGQLDELRLELDSRRRTVISLDTKRTGLEVKLKEGDATKEALLAYTSERLKHKESKLELCLTEFQNKEEELNQALRALLSEVRGLTELIGHLYQILSDAPGDAHRAFKEGISSSVQPSVHLSRHQSKTSARTDPPPEGDHSNPFLAPTSSPPPLPDDQQV